MPADETSPSRTFLRFTRLVAAASASPAETTGAAAGAGAGAAAGASAVAAGACSVSGASGVTSLIRRGLLRGVGGSRRRRHCLSRFDLLLAKQRVHTSDVPL